MSSITPTPRTTANDNDYDEVSYLHDLYYGQIDMLKARQEVYRLIVEDANPETNAYAEAKYQLDKVTTEPSMDAAYYAVAIAKKEDTSELIALHVVFSQIGYAYSSSGAFGNHLVTPGSIKKILESPKNEAKQWFDKIKEKMNNNNNNENSNNDNKIWLKTEVVVSATSIVDAIMEYAEQQKVDLIVIGTRRKAKLLLGSVASGVITCASCPVMVVK